MKTVPVVLAVFALLTAPILGSADSTPGQAGGPRLVKSRKGTPLADLRRPGERELVIEKDASKPMIVEAPPGMSELEWSTSVADVALVVRVTRVTSALTNANDWITSTVSARILDVLRANLGGAPLSVGDEVTFQQDGGDLEVDGCTLRAVVPWASGFLAGKTYLIFGSVSDEPHQLMVTREVAFEVSTGSVLAPLAHRGRIREESGLPLATAADRIRAAAKRHR